MVKKVKSDDISECENPCSVLESKEEENENESESGAEESCSKEDITKKESLDIEKHFSCKFLPFYCKFQLFGFVWLIPLNVV